MPIFFLNPCSVLDLLKSMEKACGRTIPYKIGPRRAGDVAALYANPDQAKVSLFSIISRRFSLINFFERFAAVAPGLGSEAGVSGHGR
jgi:hypothetical protein